MNPETIERHKYHGHGEHPSFCAACKNELATGEAEAQAARDAHIDSLTCNFVTLAEEAERAVYQLRGTVSEMIEAYDVEMAEGSEGTDALRELETAAAALRHVRRIAQWRRDLELRSAGVTP